MEDYMKVHEAIDAADALLRNSVSESQKVRWLAELDGRILLELIDTHNIKLSGSWCDYVRDIMLSPDRWDIICTGEEYHVFPFGGLLLAALPYDDMYVHYLLFMIYITTQEINRANNELAVFNETYDRYSAYINRTYRPAQATKITLG
jgi:hypothetical protein